MSGQLGQYCTDQKQLKGRNTMSGGRYRYHMYVAESLLRIGFSAYMPKLNLLGDYYFDDRRLGRHCNVQLAREGLMLCGYHTCGAMLSLPLTMVRLRTSKLAGVASYWTVLTSLRCELVSMCPGLAKALGSKATSSLGSWRPTQCR
jgi:hypothetical protein